ncbi:MAG: folylpolyglutamate synthase/dihydrofolate synthase family protein [Candidatus Eisenbacteria bacterium]
MRRAEYERLVSRLYALEKRGMRLTLDGTRTILKRLGSPEKRLPSALVAGTNGKGSSCALMASVLRRAGYCTGLYTSPHLVDFRERIRIGGECISKEEAFELLRSVVPIAEKGGHSFFETMTALALRHFRDRNVDLLVAEVGLGGRLDSTNVLSPLVSVITGVAIEHRHILGRTLSAIAREKAGIMRRGVPVVTAARGRALETLEEISESVGASMRTLDSGLKPRALLVSRAGTVFRASWEGRSRHLFLSLRGRHQVTNAGCAVLACLELRKRGLRIGDAALESGLGEAQWPGRLEERGWNPAFVFDVAHNPQAARVLADALGTLYGGRRVIAVVGMVEDKDHSGFLKRIVPRVEHVVLTQASCNRALPAAELRRRLPARFSRWSIKPNVAGAVREAVALARNDELVCVTGSFYTVGDAFRCLRIGPTECI